VSIQTNDRNAWFSPQHSTSQEASAASAEPTPQISGDLHVNADVERRPLFWTGSRDRGGRVAGDDSFTERESHHSPLFDHLANL